MPLLPPQIPLTHVLYADTVAFVYGPQGSGKATMISTLLKQSGRSVSRRKPRGVVPNGFGRRKSLVIDANELSKATSDAALLSSLARQTGYWPVFSVFNSLNNLIDLASVGLIGQKGKSLSSPFRPLPN